MRIRQLVGLLAVLLFVLVGCGTQGGYAPPTLHVERDGEVLSSLELRQHQGQTVQLDLVVTGAGTVQYVIEEPAEGWLQYNAYTGGVASLKGGERRTIELDYQCGTTAPTATEFIVRIVDGDDIVLPASLIGCVEAGDPEDEVVFVHEGEVVEGLAFTHAGTTSLTVENRGITDVSFELSTFDSWLKIDSQITGVRTLAAGASLDLPITFSCTAAGGAQNSAIEIDFVDAGVKTLPFELAGCDVPSDPTDAVVFTFDDEVVEGLAFPSDGEATVFLENRGNTEVSFTLSTDDLWLRVDSHVTGTRTLAPGATLELPLLFTCPAAGQQQSALVVTFSNSDTVSLTVDLTDCEMAPQPHEAVVFVFEGDEIDHLRLDTSETSVDVTLRNLGTADVSFTLEAGKPWFEVGGQNVGVIQLAGNSERTVTLNYECADVVDQQGRFWVEFVGGTDISLLLTLPGCEAPPQPNPSEDLVFFYDGGEVTDPLTFQVSDMDTVILKNVGLASISFELKADLSSNVFIASSARNGRTLEPGASLEVPLSFACNGATTPYDAVIDVYVDNNPEVALELTIEGCVEEPTPAPETVLKFTYDGGVVTGPLARSIDDPVTVRLENRGQLPLEVELAPTNTGHIQIASSAGGLRTIGPEQYLEIPLSFTCEESVYSPYYDAVEVLYEGSALTDVVLALSLSGCDAEPTPNLPDDLVFMYDGGDVTDTLSFAVSQSPITVRLENRGAAPITLQLGVSDPAHVTIDSSAANVRTIAAGGYLDVPLTFACDGANFGTYTEAVTVSVGGTILTGVGLSLSITGCDSPPQADPDDDLVFMYDGGVVEGALEFAFNEAPTVHLQNNGPLPIEVRLVPTNATHVQIGSGAQNLRTIPPGEYLEVPLQFACDGTNTGPYFDAIDVVANGTATTVALNLTIADCELAQSSDPDEDLVFTYLGGDVDPADGLTFALTDGSAVVRLENRGPEAISVKLSSTHSGHIAIGPTAQNVRVIDSGDFLAVPITFACGGMDTTFDETIEVEANGTASTVELLVEITGCTAGPTPLDPEDAVMFATLSGEPIEVLGLNEGDTSVDLAIRNIGDTDVKFIVDTSHPALKVDTNNIGTRTVAGQSDLPLTLTYECTATTMPHVEYVALYFSDGGSISIPVSLPGCTVDTPPAFDPQAAIVTRVNGNKASAIALFAEGVGVPTFEVSFENTGDETVTLSANLALGVTPAGWIRITDVGVGYLTIDPGETVTRTLAYVDTCPQPGPYDASITVHYQGADPATDQTITISLFGCP